MKTCGSCWHWEKGEVDPTDLAAVRIGECRERIHMIALPVLTLKGPGAQIQTTYARVPADFPACSHWKDAEGE